MATMNRSANQLIALRYGLGYQYTDEQLLQAAQKGMPLATKQAAETRKKLAALQEELTQKAKDMEQKTKSLHLTDPQAISNHAEEWTFLNRWQSAIHEALSTL